VIVWVPSLLMIGFVDVSIEHFYSVCSFVVACCTLRLCIVVLVLFLTAKSDKRFFWAWR
jgi:hypothetical protein